MIEFRKPRRAVSRVFLHCSASDHLHHDDIAVLRQWHLKRGFDDVGYHYLITFDGRVQAGRSLEKQPAAQAGHPPSTDGDGDGHAGRHGAGGGDILGRNSTSNLERF